MEVPEGWDFEAWVSQQMEAVETDSAARMLRDQWVTLRSFQECSDCRAELPHGEHVRHVVRVIEGEGLVSQYTCARCDEQTRNPHAGRHAA